MSNHLKKVLRGNNLCDIPRLYKHYYERLDEPMCRRCTNRLPVRDGLCFGCYFPKTKVQMKLRAMCIRMRERMGLREPIGILRDFELGRDCLSDPTSVIARREKQWKHYTQVGAIEVRRRRRETYRKRYGQPNKATQTATP